MKQRLLFHTISCLVWLACLGWVMPVQGQTVTVVAGTGTSGNSGNGGAATSAQLSTPQDVVVDNTGNYFITDLTNHDVRRVDAQTGIITRIAGTDAAGFSGIPGPADSAALTQPQGMTIDGQGNVYFSHRADSSAVLKVNTTTGTIAIVAGGKGNSSSGDGGQATKAAIYQPWGVEVVDDSVLYINDAMARIRMVNLATGIISTIAGTGTAGASGDGGLATSAEIEDSVVNITRDKAGNLYLAQVKNNVIRKIDPNGVITTFAGQAGSTTASGDGGPASAAAFQNLWDIEYDAFTNSLYISDMGAGTIRKIDLATNNISAVASGLTQPKGIGVDRVGDIYVAEEGNAQVKKIEFPRSVEIALLGKGVEIANNAATPSLVNGTDLGTVNVGESVSAVFTIRNDGNGTLNVTNIASDNGTVFAISGLPATIEGVSSGTFLVVFTPSAAGLASATITITNDDADEGTYTFAVQANAAQGIENALDFDGTDDYVKTSTLIKSSYTKEAWVYFKGADQLNNIVSGNTTTANTAFWVPNNNGLRLAAGHNGKWFMVQDSAVFPVNRWVHVAVTYDEAKNTMTLYKNGVQVAQNKSIPKNFDYNAEGDSLLIGSYTDQFFFDGMMDEVRIWNYARSSAEINSNINSGLTGSENGLIAYYSFNQGVPAGDNAGLNTLYDRAPNGNNGTLQNFALSGATSNWVGSTALSSDITPPSGYTATIDQALLTLDNHSAVSFTFAGAEAGATYIYEFKDTAKVVVSGTGTVISATDQVAGIDLSGLSDGEITLSVTLTDPAGNVGAKATDVVNKDTTGPSVAIASTVSGVTNQSPIPLTITFSEQVREFALDDLTVGNGSIGNLQTTDSITFTAAITPVNNGMVTVDLAAGVVTDTLGLPNTAASQFSIDYDTSAPTVTISTDADSVLNQNSFGVTIVFSEAVSGFALSDLKVTGGEAANLQTSDSTTFTANITVTAKGTITVEVPAGVATSKAGNHNVAAKPLNLFNQGTAPTVSLSTTAGNPTNASPIPVTITFSDAVKGFMQEDITVENGSVTALSTEDSITFTAEVTPAADGVVNISVAAGVAQDGVGNTNQASETLSITYSSSGAGTAPTVSLSTTAGNPTNMSPIPVSITFSEAVEGFAQEDITVENGSVTNLSTMDNTAFTADITPAADGTVSISIAQDVAQDSEGNGNEPSETLSLTYDGTAPTVAFSTTEGDTTQTSPFRVTITFSEKVNGFDSTDLMLTNASAVVYLQTSDSTTFTVDIAPEADGAVKLDIAANAANDAAGNGNTAAETFSIIYQSAPTGIEELFVDRTMGVYPVPASQYLKIACRLKQTAVVSITLAGTNGKLIQQKSLGKVNTVKETLWLNQIPDGLYMLTLYVDGKPLTRKIIVSK